MYGQGEGGTRVTVKKDELLAILRKNREQHRATFLKAQDGYRRVAIENLDEMLKNARENRGIVTSVHLPVPINHTKEYDRNIKMLEMSINNKMVISEEQFSSFVEDDWGWKSEFIGTSSRYTG